MKTAKRGNMESKLSEKVNVLPTIVECSLHFQAEVKARKEDNYQGYFGQIHVCIV